jgi:hypothetical protein
MNSDDNTGKFDEGFDWGFTAVTLDELDVIQETTAQLEEQGAKLEESDAESSDLRNRLDKVYAAIQPLLNNLKSDGTKEYIWWPNRMQKIEAFSDHIDALYLGTKK